MTHTQQPGFQSYNQPAAAQSNGLAIAALVCGIVGMCVPLLGIVALVLGIVALVRLKNGQRKGVAIGGIVLGALSLLLLPLLLGILLPSLNRAREAANRIKCAANMRQIGQALSLYTAENRGAYPDNLATLANAEPLSPDVFVCPSSSDDMPTAGNWQQSLVAGNGMCSYVYYYDPKVSESAAPMNYVVLYEPMKDHDDDGANFLFADGSVQFLAKAQAATAIQELESKQNPPRTLAGPAPIRKR